MASRKERKWLSPNLLKSDVLKGRNGFAKIPASGTLQGCRQVPAQAQTLERSAICWQPGMCQPPGWPLTQLLSHVILTRLVNAAISIYKWGNRGSEHLSHWPYSHLAAKGWARITPQHGLSPIPKGPLSVWPAGHLPLPPYCQVALVKASTFTDFIY